MWRVRVARVAVPRLFEGRARRALRMAHCALGQSNRTIEGVQKRHRWARGVKIRAIAKRRPSRVQNQIFQHVIAGASSVFPYLAEHTKHLPSARRAPRLRRFCARAIPKLEWWTIWQCTSGDPRCQAAGSTAAPACRHEAMAEVAFLSATVFPAK